MKQTTYARIGRVAVVVAQLGLVAGLAVGIGGLAPIAASSGHWAVTEWALQLFKRRSVATQSLGLSPPNLDDPVLVMTGAGHYEAGCRFCHGAPGERMPVVPRHELPHPPRLDGSVRQYEPRELHFIVMNGLKFTGMPAWPAPQRPDEVWAVVAFLQRLPELDAAEYRSLVSPSQTEGHSRAPEVVQEICARCHGADGLGGRGAAFPILAGQKPEYLRRSLEAYAAGERYSGIMQPIAFGLTVRQVSSAVDWYASTKRALGARTPDALEGERIARRGIAERKIPACADCHTRASHPSYPLLEGQPVHYLRRQIRLFAENRRGGTKFASLMDNVAIHALTDAEADAVARFFGVQATPE